MAKQGLQRRKSQSPARTGERYLHGFIVTGSTGRNYKISFDTARGCWICSCPGCLSHQKTCKHLRACGVVGPERLKQSLPTKDQAQSAQHRALPRGY